MKRKKTAADSPAPSGSRELTSAEALLRQDIEAASRYASASRATSTRRLYESDWRHFEAWCERRNLKPMPADPRIVATYMASEADRGLLPPTLTRRMAAIGWKHRQDGFLPPQKTAEAAPLLEVMSGIRRSREKPVKKATAAEANVLTKMLQATPPDSLRNVRDRAILALGMAAALRRSEIVALLVEDLDRQPNGLLITVRSSKTDQESQGEVVGIPHGKGIRPIELLDAWLADAGISEGPIFRTFGRSGRVLDHEMCDRDIARIVAKAAARAGLGTTGFSGHSLRSGFITSAAQQGVTVFRIKEVSRHKSIQVLAGYVRNTELLKDAAGSGFL